MHYVYGRLIHALVDEHGQIVVRQRHVLHGRRRAALAAAIAPALGLCRKRKNQSFKDLGDVIKIITFAGGGGKWMMGGFSPEYTMGPP